MLKSLKLLSDPTRLRILHAAAAGGAVGGRAAGDSGMGQSRISTQLSQLKAGGLVADRRSGKNIFYRFRNPSGEKNGSLRRVLDLIAEATGEIVEIASDEAALDLALRKRKDKARAYFDELAGKFGEVVLSRAVVEGVGGDVAQADAASGDRGSRGG